MSQLECIRCGCEDSETINGCDLCLKCGEREPRLPWAVEVLASGGWMILARFANETDAWEYGARQLRARVYHDYELRGERIDGGWTSGSRVGAKA